VWTTPSTSSHSHDGAGWGQWDAAAAGINLTMVKELLVVVDRLSVDPAHAGRLADAIGTAFAEGDGDCVILLANAIPSPLDGAPVDRLRFTERFECPNDGTRAPAPTPQLFSFNNPRGACARCNGFGAVLEYDESLIVPYPEVFRSVKLRNLAMVKRCCDAILNVVYWHIAEQHESQG